MDRLAKQLDFLLTAERLTGVQRRNVLFDLSRQESSAEHSWHMALMAAVLREHFPEEIDLSRALEMSLAHDLIEVHAGDTFAYDDASKADKDAREQRGADLLFGQLPDDQAQRLRALWDWAEGAGAEPTVEQGAYCLTDPSPTRTRYILRLSVDVPRRRDRYLGARHGHTDAAGLPIRMRGRPWLDNSRTRR